MNRAVRPEVVRTTYVPVGHPSVRKVDHPDADNGHLAT